MDDELKELLSKRADEVRVEPEMPRPVLRRARRRRVLNGALAGLTAAIVVAGAVIGIRTALQDRGVPANTPSPSATVGASSGTEPEEVARGFAKAQMGWDAGVTTERTDVSPTEVRVDLWNLAVTKRAGVEAHAPSFAITFTLDQSKDATWRISDIRTRLIDLECPSSRQDVLVVGERQELCGTLAWTPAEGIVDAALYPGELPAPDSPAAPAAMCRAPISFPQFHGRFGPMPGGADSAFLVVGLVDPQGVTIGLMARKMALERPS